MMNEKEIVAFSGLNSDNIDPADYTNTLTAEALRAGIITEADLDRIRADFGRGCQRRGGEASEH